MENEFFEETNSIEVSNPSVLELIYGIFFSPVRTLRLLTGEPRLGWGVAIFIATYGFQSLMNYALGGKVPVNLGPVPALEQIANSWLKQGWVIGLPFLSIFWFLLASCYHSIAGLFKREGTIQGLLSGFGFASLPLLVNTLIEFLRHVTLLSFGVTVWLIVLQIIVLRENYKISTSKAVLIYLLPLIVFIGALIFTITIFFSTMLPLFEQLYL